MPDVPKRAIWAGSLLTLDGSGHWRCRQETRLPIDRLPLLLSSCCLHNTKQPRPLLGSTIIENFMSTLKMMNKSPKHVCILYGGSKSIHNGIQCSIADTLSTTESKVFSGAAIAATATATLIGSLTCHCFFLPPPSLSRASREIRGVPAAKTKIFSACKIVSGPAHSKDWENAGNVRLAFSSWEHWNTGTAHRGFR